MVGSEEIMSTALKKKGFTNPSCSTFVKESGRIGSIAENNQFPILERWLGKRNIYYVTSECW